MSNAPRTDANTPLEVIDEKLLPKVDMLFDSENEAYEFYNTYAENVGFFVRRSTLWTTSKNIITRRTFVCSREGFREKKKGAKEAKCPRPETRIGCPACMTIRLTSNGKYRVTEFVSNHNHMLATVSTIHMLRTKKLRRKARAVRADLVDDSVTTPVFETEDEAYEFYSMYAGRIGFSVRRASMTVNSDNAITRRMFVCSREGFREKKKGAKRVKKPRPETRTGCPACMIIRLGQDGKYHVSEFVTYHNHQLAASSSAELVMSNRVENDQDNESDLGDKSGDDTIKKQVKVQENPSIECLDSKNNLRSKRMKVMHVGDVGATLEYLQKMQSDNPSFSYSLHVDDDDSITGFFWADAKSTLDFIHFGDVVCFDTTYKACGYGRPFALFTGVNHHKQTVIFGAAIIYDESKEFFQWLFGTFKMAMNGRQPKTILTDRCSALSDAVAAAWPGTTHRFCVWQIYQSALVRLSQAFHGSRTLGCDFSRCLFDYEDEDEFLSAWREMLEKYDLKDNQWLAKLFDEREKWALVYGRETFYADLKSVQHKESLNIELKKYLSLETELSSFFEQYERILDERRCAELQADVNASQSTKKPPSMRMLKQAANVYTPNAFKMFEREFELYMDCMLYNSGEVGTISQYKITVEDKPGDHFVKFDSLDGTVNCTCKKFEFIGIPCRHVLKVLDTRNIKELPPQYILKRWRRDAKIGSLSGNYTSFPFDGDTQSSQAKRYNYLCRIFSIAASRAARSFDSYAFMESQSDVLWDQVEQVLQSRHPDMSTLISSISDRPHNPVENVIAGSIHYDKTNHTSFIGSAADGTCFPVYIL